MKYVRLIVLLSFCLIISSYLMFHTFSYDPDMNAILIGSKLWSDFSAHIPLIRSFSIGNNWPPQYPIFPGEPIRYHFLFYLLVGVLEKIGFRIDWALNIPSILGFAGLLTLIFYLAKTIFHSSAVGILSVLFFLFNSSLSFLIFFQKHPFSFSTPWDIFTNTAFSSFGPWDGGLVSAFWTLNIYTNQRHLAMAFALGLGLIALFLWLEKKSWKRQLPYLFCTVPILCAFPYFHQPMLLIVGLWMAWFFLVFPKLRIFLVLTGLLSITPILLQLRTMGGDTSQFAWYPGYLIHNQLSPRLFLIYWWQNLGLQLLLILIGFFLAPKRAKKIVAPIFFLFIIANCFKFSVEIAANHKFFNFCMIFGSMLSAYLLVYLWERAGRYNFLSTLTQGSTRKNATENIMLLERCAKKFIPTSARIMIIIIVFFLTLSGVIDLFPVINDTVIPLSDIPKNEVATWINDNTPKDALFLNSSYLYHPASIAGRPIFLGWPYFPWSAGYSENRMPIMKTMYESRNPEVFCPLFENYHISYITVEPVSGNPDLPVIDPTYFRSVAVPVFSLPNSYDIYTKEALCHGK